MATLQPANFEQLGQRIERAHRKALARTLFLSAATVAVAALFLIFTYYQYAAINAARAKAEDDLKGAQQALKSAVDRATSLQGQITNLNAQLAATQERLANAINLGKHSYTLEWDQLKMMALENGSAVEILEVVERLKDRVHWDRENTRPDGYDSPHFAALVLLQLHRLRQGADLDSLPQDSGLPHPGDIVRYESGYALFYFRDHRRREFVVGMTPFGVTSLSYDFGVKRISVLRTGLSTK